MNNTFANFSAMMFLSYIAFFIAILRSILKALIEHQLKKVWLGLVILSVGTAVGIASWFFWLLYHDSIAVWLSNVLFDYLR